MGNILGLDIVDAQYNTIGIGYIEWFQGRDHYRWESQTIKKFNDEKGEWEVIKEHLASHQEELIALLPKTITNFNAFRIIWKSVAIGIEIGKEQEQKRQQVERNRKKQ